MRGGGEYTHTQSHEHGNERFKWRCQIAPRLTRRNTGKTRTKKRALEGGIVCKGYCKRVRTLDTDSCESPQHQVRAQRNLVATRSLDASSLGQLAGRCSSRDKDSCETRTQTDRHSDWHSAAPTQPQRELDAATADRSASNTAH